MPKRKHRIKKEMAQARAEARPAKSPQPVASFKPTAKSLPIEPASPPAKENKGVLRDQKWALHAYTALAAVPVGAHKDYKIAINDLGANILRSGLAAAMSAIERLGDRGTVLLEHLAGAQIAGLTNADSKTLPAKIRELDVDNYMLATREILQVVVWLKRATQATCGEG